MYNSVQYLYLQRAGILRVGEKVFAKKILALFLVALMLISPLATLPVGASDPNDPDSDDDNDGDGYDANRDGEISDEEMYTNLEEYHNNTNPNGSSNNIAGILNDKKNILGMMPHPERVIDPILSGEDGTSVAYLAQGGNGCISVTANIAPKICSNIQNAWADNNGTIIIDLSK